ncbi:MAG: NAD-glutamate dehydrogenase, partial [Pseudomonadota bacterium]
DLDGLAAALADWVSTLPVDEQTVRVRDTADDEHVFGAAVLESCGPDKPFLVDSLLNACNALGHPVRTLFHPICKGDGVKRSIIQIHLPRLTADEQAALQEEAERTLGDVKIAVDDYTAMRALMKEEVHKLSTADFLNADDREESVAFLEWLAKEHFVFLGARRYVFETDSDGAFLPEEPVMVEGTNLGMLRDEARNVLNRGAEPTLLTPEIGAFLQEPTPLILSKSTMLSRVHRRVFADYVGVKQYDDQGHVNGEIRFAGLFTAEAYDETARSIPLIRRRAAKIIEASGATPGGHSAKALSNLIETWPRDELFQTDAETLTPMLLGALHLIGRPRARVFVRRDRFDRFVSIIVYAPRDAYDSRLREQIGELMEDRFGGRLISFQPSFDSGPLARVHFQIALSQGHAEPDIDALEKEVTALATTWGDAFRDALAAAGLDPDQEGRAALLKTAFSAGYREAFEPEEAITDVAELAMLDETRPVRMRAYRGASDSADMVRAKIYSRNGAVALSDCVPIFEDMGLFVNFETGYPIRPETPPSPGAPDVYWIHALAMCDGSGRELDLKEVGERFEDAFVDVWRGRAENDGFNRLVLTAGATPREAALIRALSAYRSQSGLDPASATQIRAFVLHPNLTRTLLDLFAARFDPKGGAAIEDRAIKADKLRADIEQGLNSVSALDEDRVIRRTADLIMAIQRTNFYQRSASGGPIPAITFKIASAELDELPSPKPYREIFVSSPEVEGVHLRFGPVARGGLRWSDRRDDFRTEVLGLVKAQQVKNAVIVPVGSKGGFYPKMLPENGSREEIREAGIAAYKTFISSLLELTDNLIDGAVHHPENTVVWDGDDPYLVVAADKGTATFSDTANEISEAHGFWLGDAFASGGSAGYDHKKMGITARGAWEAVKRHFREMGKDIQTQPFTVIGVGDMSGDVFGNGMLLSRKIKLLAAFNHLHIFIDPSPEDTEAAWEERKRIFDLPRSSWADYDDSLISKGGGIFERSAKSIPLSDEIKALTGLSADSVTPNDLLHALLKADAELLWFGGIGTYAKASGESHTDAGDRANDGIRVDANEFNVKVIGEGANLGLTQAARIEFATKGGRINTDAIDNSAGVDSSDHEVNIKILASEAIRSGVLPSGERNILLADMTDDVAAHVLAHNYDQTGALSLAEETAKADHEALERLMVYLEERGVLNRALEELPLSAEMEARREAGKWLTRPELSVLLAWSKITLFDDIVASDLPDDPYLQATAQAYFPEAIRKYGDAIDAHRLKREIIATVVSNRLLDVAGPVFLARLREATGESNADLARAFEAARALLNFPTFSEQVNALDNRVEADVQDQLRLEAASGLSVATAWLAEQERGNPLTEIIGGFEEKLDAFKSSLRDTGAAFGSARIERRTRSLVKRGAPEELARWAAAMPQFAEGIAVARLASRTGKPVKNVASQYYALGDMLRLDRLRAAAEDSLVSASYWDRVATRRLVDELTAMQIAATAAVMDHGGDASIWLDTRNGSRADVVSTLKELSRERRWSFSKFALSADAVRRFLAL